MKESHVLTVRSLILVLSILLLVGCVDSRQFLRGDLRRCKGETVPTSFHVSGIMSRLGVTCRVRRLRFIRPVYVSTRTVHPAYPKGLVSHAGCPSSEFELAVIRRKQMDPAKPQCRGVTFTLLPLKPECSDNDRHRWSVGKGLRMLSSSWQYNPSFFSSRSPHYVELGREYPLFTYAERGVPVDADGGDPVESALAVYITFSRTPMKSSGQADGRVPKTGADNSVNIEVHSHPSEEVP